MVSKCPLCLNNDTILYSKDLLRQYYFCKKCHLVFVPAEFHISLQAEKERYDYHDNNPDNPGYRNFLNQLVQPLIPLLKKPYNGIDFGSGPIPVLSLLLETAGFQMSNFDPFYANEENITSQKYDFLTSCEVIEHFRNPLEEWNKMIAMVKNRGLIAISTETLSENISFNTWYYKSDKTHICFYSEKTFKWLAEHFQLKKRYTQSPVRIFQKS